MSAMSPARSFRCGYVDFAYIRPEAQHTGLFRQLAHSRAGDRTGRAAAVGPRGLMAEPAFARFGFTVRRRNASGWAGRISTGARWSG